jgi:hypothetical protein
MHLVAYLKAFGVKWDVKLFYNLMDKMMTFFKIYTRI